MRRTIEIHSEKSDGRERTQRCREIDGRNNELRCLQGPIDERGDPVFTDEVKKIEAGYDEDLEVHFEDGRIEDCVNIRNGRREMKCNRHWDDDRDRVEFSVYEVDRIETTSHNKQ